LIKEHSSEEVSAQEIEELLQLLVNSGLMMKECKSYLSLAIHLGEYSPSNKVLEKFLIANHTVSGDCMAIIFEPQMDANCANEGDQLITFVETPKLQNDTNVVVVRAVPEGGLYRKNLHFIS